MVDVKTFFRNLALPFSNLKKSICDRSGPASDHWYGEYIALIIAASSMTSAGLLLYYYDNKPISAWTQTLTLNATISVLATLARTMMLVSTAACLGQYKWIWYNGETYPLRDFELINEASRGPGGSLMMLLRSVPLLFRNHRAWACVGCLVVILAQMLDPFLQQVLNVTDKPSFAQNAYAPYANRWSNATITSTFMGVLRYPVQYWSDVVSEQQAHVNFNIDAAINTGFTANASTIAQQLNITCGSGNCTWDKYHSLSVCGKCSDITSQIIKGERDDVEDLAAWFQDPEGVKAAVDVTWYNLVFQTGIAQTINNPNNYSTNSTERIVMTGLVNWNAGYSKSFTNYSTLLVSMTYLWADLDDNNRYSDWANAKVAASECGLYLCVKEYSTKVMDGIISETSTEISSTRATGSYHIIGTPPETNLSIINLLDTSLTTQRTDLEVQVPHGASSQGPFTMTQAGVTGLMTALMKFFDDGTLWWTSPNLETHNIDRVQIVAGVTGMVRLVPTSNTFEYLPSTMEGFWNNRGNNQFSALFQNLATSLTNTIRVTSDNHPAFSGTQQSSTSIFTVRWRWIVPSVLGMVLAIVFQFIVRIESKRTHTPIWKSSTIAILFHGLSISLKMAIPPAIYKSETDHHAKALNVELRETDNGICLDGTVNSQEYNDEDTVSLISFSGKSKHSRFSGTTGSDHFNAVVEAMEQIANTG